MKFITWNVQWFCGLDDVVDLERVVNDANAFAGEGGFDVLCMQEVAVNYPRLPGNAGFDQPAVLRKLLPGYHVFFGPAVDEFNPEAATLGQRQQFGNVIATRLPVLQVQHYPLAYPADTTAGAVRSMPRMCTCVTVRDPTLGTVRIMTTHLEFYSTIQRLAQVHAVRALHAQACTQAAYPPLQDDTGWPFQSKEHTVRAIVCGDWNFEPQSTEYQLIQSEVLLENTINHARDNIKNKATQFLDAWRLVHGDRPHEPTFRLFDRRYGPVPITCDFVFLTDDLKACVRSVSVELQTRASDHQPVMVELI